MGQSLMYIGVYVTLDRRFCDSNDFDQHIYYELVINNFHADFEKSAYTHITLFYTSIFSVILYVVPLIRHNLSLCVCVSFQVLNVIISIRVDLDLKY